jgi:hypothetical protein
MVQDVGKRCLLRYFIMLNGKYIVYAVIFIDEYNIGYYFHLLKHWGRVFEPHSRHGCLSAIFLRLCCSDFATGSSPVQEVIQAFYKIKKPSEAKRFTGVFYFRGSNRKYELMSEYYRLKEPI